MSIFKKNSIKINLSLMQLKIVLQNPKMVQTHLHKLFFCRSLPVALMVLNYLSIKIHLAQFSAESN